MNSPLVQASTPPLSRPPPSSSAQSHETNHLSVQDIEIESPLDDMPTSPKRTDGRRQTELSNTPSLSTTSRLYGQPAWWGEDGRPHPPADNEYRHAQHGSQILRDFDSDDASSVSSGRSAKLSVKDELRLKAISKSHEQQSPNSAWVVDFTPSSKPHPHSKPRPRSADHSPVRAPPVVNNSASATSLSRKKQSTFVKHRSPVSTKEVANKEVTKKPRSTSSLTRSATTKRSNPQTVRTSALDAKSRRKSGSLSDITSKTAESKSDVKQSTLDSKTRKKSGSLSNITARKATDKPSGTKNGGHGSSSKGIDSKARKKSGSTSDITGKHSMVDKTYTKIGGQGSSDELQTSISDLSLASSAEPVIVGEGLKSASSEGCGEGSARKKWTKEQQEQVRDRWELNI